MTRTVAVDELKVGMFVHLDLGWMSHPFPRSSFRIADTQQIDTIRGLGLAVLRWDPERSQVVDPAPVPEGEPAPMAAPPARAPLETEASPQERAAQARRAELAQQREAAELCEAQYQEAGDAWQQAFEQVLERPEAARRDTEALSRALLDKMLVEGEMCIRVLNAASGDRATAHAMNVAVISLLMGRVFGLDDEELSDLGTGALLHDVGKLGVPERLRHPDEKFTAAEHKAYTDHVANGVHQARRMGLSRGATLVIAQHHEMADATGFPQKLPNDRLSMAARVVSLVNRFDNLCNPPVLARALTPHEALSQLFSQARSKFDATVLNTFIRMMGVYPAGSVVQLTDDRYALVMTVNSSRPLRPHVLVHDPDVPRDEALHLDLEAVPDLGIRRSIRAAQLPPDALSYLAPRPRVAYFFEPGPAPAVERPDRNQG